MREQGMPCRGAWATQSLSSTPLPLPIQLLSCSNSPIPTYQSFIYSAALSPIIIIRMNFRVLFHKQQYNLSQDFPNYNDLYDQIKYSIPNIPDLFSVIYLGDHNTKTNINNQEDVEALHHLGGSVTLQVEDLNEDIFNMTLEENNQEVEMNVGEEKQEMEEEGEENGNQYSPQFMVQGHSIPFPNMKSSEEAMIENVTCIETVFGITYDQAVEFVSQNPGLNQEQLIQLAMELKNQNQGS